MMNFPDLSSFLHVNEIGFFPSGVYSPYTSCDASLIFVLTKETRWLMHASTKNRDALSVTIGFFIHCGLL